MTGPPLYVLLGITAGILWAVNNVIDKVAVPNFGINVFTIITSFSAFLFALPLLFINQFSFFKSVNIPSGDPIVWSSVITAGAVYILAVHLYASSLNEGDVSRLAPLLETTPLYVLILGILILDELLSFYNFLGVLLIVFGAILVSPEDFGFQFFDLKVNRPFWLMNAGSLCFGISIILTRYAITTGDGFNYATVFFWSRVSGLIPGVLLLFTLYIKGMSEEVKIQGVGLIAVSELINDAGLLASTAALALGPAAIVSAASSTSPLFVLLFVLPFSISNYTGALNEDLTKKSIFWKLMSAILIIVGVYFLSGGTII